MLSFLLKFLQHVLNSGIIGDVNILRIITAIGRELRFLINVNLSTLHQLTQDNAQSVIDCLP